MAIARQVIELSATFYNVLLSILTISCLPNGKFNVCDRALHMRMDDKRGESTMGATEQSTAHDNLDESVHRRRCVL